MFLTAIHRHNLESLKVCRCGQNAYRRPPATASAPLLGLKTLSRVRQSHETLRLVLSRTTRGPTPPVHRRFCSLTRATARLLKSSRPPRGLLFLEHYNSGELGPVRTPRKHSCIRRSALQSPNRHGWPHQLGLSLVHRIVEHVHRVGPVTHVRCCRRNDHFTVVILACLTALHHRYQLLSDDIREGGCIEHRGHS